MEDSVCLDTDILVDLLRDNPEVVKWIEDNKDKFEFVTTVVNVFELYSGAYKAKDGKKKIKDVEELIEKLTILDFLIKDSKEAGRFRVILEKKGKIIDIRDLFIGTIALTNGCSLKTNNKKHFSRIEGLRVV